MLLRTSLLLLTLAASTALNAQTPSTAAEVISTILHATGATPPPNTVDTIKAGDPSTPITGIATTFTPTMAVLRQAVASGKNLIVTHEPSFYNHLDDPALFTSDPVYLEKLAYIREHHLVLWRFHDAWHLRQPDGIAEGFIAVVGWEKYRNPGEQMFFTLPPTTLLDLATDLQRRFGSRSIRIVGDPQMRLTHVAYRPGASGELKQVKALERDDVEVLVAGESSEWETVEYVRDASLQGRHKALILLGHDISEEIGMQNCAQWLQKIFPSIPVQYIPAGEPFWTPQHLP